MENPFSFCASSPLMVTGKARMYSMLVGAGTKRRQGQDFPILKASHIGNHWEPRET